MQLSLKQYVSFHDCFMENHDKTVDAYVSDNLREAESLETFCKGMLEGLKAIDIDTYELFVGVLKDKFKEDFSEY